MNIDSINPCQACGHATFQYVCSSCADSLGVLLGELPDVATALLDVTEVAQRSSWGASLGSRKRPGPSDPLPTETAEVARGKVDDAKAVVESWCDWVSSELDEAPDATTFRARCAFLADRLEWVSTQEWAGELVSEVGRLASVLNSALAGFSDQREYVGRCSSETCQGHLYAGTGAVQVRCPECDAVYVTQEKRTELRREAARLMVTADMAADMLVPELGKWVTPRAIRRYAKAGLLRKVGTMPVKTRPAAVYFLGDVKNAASAAKVVHENRVVVDSEAV